MTRRYCSGTLSNENDSLDGRQDGGVGGAQAPPSGGAGSRVKKRGPLGVRRMNALSKYYGDLE